MLLKSKAENNWNEEANFDLPFENLSSSGDFNRQLSIKFRRRCKNIPVTLAGY